jgi:hypothetical protein
MKRDEKQRELKLALGRRVRGRAISDGALKAARHTFGSDEAKERRRSPSHGRSESRSTRSAVAAGDHPEKLKGSLVPVEVDVGRRGSRAEIVVTRPRGLVIEGLDVDALCDVVARIG